MSQIYDNQRTNIRIRLKMFDVDAAISTDSAAFADVLAKMYRRFHQPQTDTRPTIAYKVLTSPENKWGYAVLVRGSETQRLRDMRQLDAYLYDGVLNHIIAAVKSHFLIHASVVSWHGQGVAFVADAAHGKTTLALSLTKLGYQFLSDEIAAIARTDGQVYPFPRSLRVREGTLALCGLPTPTPETPVWMGKYLFDIEDLLPGAVGNAVPLRHIFILQNPDAPTANLSVSDEMGVLVDRIEPELLAELRHLPSVSAVWTDIIRGYPAIHFRAERRMQTLSEMEKLCRTHDIIILDLSKRPETIPSFEAVPRLEKIPHSRATIEMLRRFQGGHHSALLRDELNGRAVRLFTELMTLIQPATVHNLYVGGLAKTLALVRGVVEKDDV